MMDSAFNFKPGFCLELAAPYLAAPGAPLNAKDINREFCRDAKAKKSASVHLE